MRHFLRSMLYVGLFVGGVIVLFEYLEGPGTPTTSSFPLSYLSLPFALLFAAAVGVFVLLAISIWRRTGEATGGFFWNKEKNDLTPFGRLLAVIAFIIWFIFAVNYLYSEPWINRFFDGLSERERWVTVVVLAALAHLPLSSLANFIVPTKGAFMRAVIYAVFVVIIAYIGSRAYTTHDFFNPETGASVAYVDPTTNAVYHRDGYAPDTGERLMPITKEVAQKIKKQSPIDLAKQKIDIVLKDALSKPSAPPPSSPPAPPKEEKKIIVTKEKRWREATWKEHNNPSTWQQPGFEPHFRRFKYRSGQRFGIPPMGDGVCTILFAEKGMFQTASGRMPIVCDDRENIAAAITDIEGWLGVCRKGKERCLIFD